MTVKSAKATMAAVLAALVVGFAALSPLQAAEDLRVGLLRFGTVNWQLDTMIAGEIYDGGDDTDTLLVSVLTDGASRAHDVRNVTLQNLEQIEFYSDTADYADIVTVAMLQSHMGNESEMSKVDYSHVTAFKRLGLEADSHIHSTEISEEELDNASQFLS